MRNGYQSIAMLLLVMMAMMLGGCSGTQQIEADTQSETAAKSTPVYIAEGIRKVSVVDDGKEVLEISYKPEEFESSYEYWKIRIPYGEEAVVDTEAMLELYHQLECLEFQKEAEVSDDTDTNLQDTQTKIMLEFCQTNQEEREAVLKEKAYEKTDSPSYKEKADSEYTLLIGKNNGEGYYYTALESDPKTVYLMSEDTMDAILSVQPFDLIIKVSAAANVDTVEQVTASMDGEEYHFNEEKMGKESYHTVYTELLSVLVAAEIDDEEKISDETLLSLHFKRNIGSLPDLNMEYHAYDETYASVCVNGIEKFLVKNEDLEMLKEIIKERNL